ncbi:Calcineurin-like phosphoesterase [Sanguibacter gelidistatuariae]|uniref:Calcineurin-like phosphoesterase n=1 Tax=Sanguibacter gelidistatuariae TaxID=1814289 RepID=A0A1G6HHX4_9MICO|nr:metallophosphoesterase [Sanguibacter gelidistatuariae]SDB93832.1 Calcineurin-like phosphoesterase [Sanguibacter gelidistatuariae]
MPLHLPRATTKGVAAVTAVALGCGLLAATAATAANAATAAATATSPWPLVVTEIAPDNTGYDNFEFFEVVNTSGTDIDLSAAGVKLAYTFVNSDDRTKDVPLTIPAGTVVPAGQPVVFWIDYTSGNVDTSVKTDDDFRNFYAAETGQPAGTYPIVRVTGQAGLANGGERGIRLVAADSSVISWSYYPTGSVAAARSAHFKLPSTTSARSLDVLTAAGVPSPGTVLAEALVAPTEPTDPETGEPTPDPTVPPTTDPTTPPTAPAAGTPPLMITEALPDSINVGGSDGYEFVEVYNTTDRPISFADYVLRYLYPLEDLTNSSVVDWLSTPTDPVIAPGKTLVLWVKNGPNDALTAADFNAVFGTSLTLGTDLVEVFSGGMANGSPRGLEITTRTGVSVNKAYYNLGGAKDVVVSKGLQYAYDPAAPARQTLTGSAAPTPGAVTPGQVPAAPVTSPADTSAPKVTDRTPSTFSLTEALTVDATVTDDVLTRTVTLFLKGSSDADFQAINLASDGKDGYRHAVSAADLTGKRWFDYYLVASDGSNTTTTTTRRIAAEGIDTSPVRLNVADGQFVAGTTTIAGSADTYPSPVTLDIDGAPVTTQPALEAAPVFAFEAGGVDTFFKNGVLIGTDVLRIFDDGIYSGFDTISTPVPLSYVTQGQTLTLSVYAGTKAAPAIDLGENNDDFQIKNLRLILPDGRTLRPAGYTDPAKVLNMGDSAGKLDFYDAVFTLPDDAFTARSASWDTRAVADGDHTVRATTGSDEVTRRVVVDNTAPAITSPLVEGKNYQGPFTVDAAATDAGSGIASLTATLDDDAVALPLETSSLTLQPGTHVFTATATDAAGNAATHTVTFSTPVEKPSSGSLSPGDSATVAGPGVELTATVTDPSGDILDVTFNEGYRLSPTDASVTSYSGTTRVASGLDRAGSTALSGDDLAKMTAADGIDATVTSDDAFPYQLFDVSVPEGSGDDYLARVSWSGTANAGAKVLLYVLDVATGTWQELDRHVTIGEDSTEFTLGGTVPATGHTKGGVIQVLVQHSEGFAGADQSTRTGPAARATGGSDTPRSEYDFTLGWESDTQYYNDTYYDRQLDIHNYFLDNREAMNLQYVFHTGDIVDNHTDQHQWDNATAAYQMLDDAQLPYGVLAGNHDVGHKEVDYGPYSTYFGEARFASNPWFGGSYQDNRGHYDLITAGGLDFIMLYMGWAPGDAEIAWMNDVLARYPERKAIINLHEYMLTTGGLGEVPQRIHDEVVATNPNVIMVFSGHYHDAFTRVDAFDDDGDGVPDRKVHQILFDYQGLPEGGQAFLRLMHFDNEGKTITSRTYSPYLDQFNSTDPSLEIQHQEFTMDYADFNLVPQTKSLGTDFFSAEILTTHAIASFADVASGTTLSATWETPGAGLHGWYVTTTDPFGAIDRSAVQLLTVAAGPVVPTDPPTKPVEPGTGGAGSGGTGSGGTGSGSTGTPGATDPAAPSSGKAAGDAGGKASGELAMTGTSAGLFLLLGLAFSLLTAGATAVVAARARRGARE